MSEKEGKILFWAITSSVGIATIIIDWYFGFLLITGILYTILFIVVPVTFALICINAIIRQKNVYIPLGYEARLKIIYQAKKDLRLCNKIITDLSNKSYRRSKDEELALKGAFQERERLEFLIRFQESGLPDCFKTQINGPYDLLPEDNDNKPTQ